MFNIVYIKTQPLSNNEGTTLNAKACT